MKIKALIASSSVALLIAGGAIAGTISALGNDGTIYNIDVATRLATPFTTVPDSTGTQAQFSPNALGVSDDGAVWTTASFNQRGNTEQLYINGVFVRDVTIQSFAIAAGDTENGTYYFVDSGDNLYSATGNGAVAPTSVELAVDTGTLGDIAISGTTAYLSHNNLFTTFNLGDDLTDAASFSSIDQDRFVGLGFAGDDLYGIKRESASEFELWSIDTSTSTLAFMNLGTISGLNPGTEFTDASSAVVPLPAAGWMLLAGLGGLVAMKRRKREAV